MPWHRQFDQNRMQSWFINVLRGGGEPAAPNADLSPDAGLPADDPPDLSGAARPAALDGADGQLLRQSIFPGLSPQSLFRIGASGISRRCALFCGRRGIPPVAPVTFPFRYFRVSQDFPAGNDDTLSLNSRHRPGGKLETEIAVLLPGAFILLSTLINASTRLN